jgi:hypothetical protein
MRFAAILACTFAACSFDVDPVHVDTPSDPGLAPAPTPSLPPASTPDAPDLSQAAPDLAGAPDLAQAPLVCASDCRVNVPDNTSATVICEANCDVMCGAGATCDVQCDQGAQCTCHGNGCVLSGCAPVKCKMALICNQQCD